MDKVKKNYPIVIFVYNRRNYLEHTFEALKKCNNVEKHDCYIFCDAANIKKIDDEESVSKVREYVEFIDHSKIFKNTEVFYAEKHMGSKNSVIHGMNYVLKKNEAVIDIEDDIIVVKNFLDYMDSALAYFENRKDVGMIAGYSYPLKVIEDYEYDNFFSKHFSPWGFGIWADRWFDIDWEIEDYEDFIKDDERKRNFSESGYDLINMLMALKEGALDAWDIQMMYSFYKKNRVVVYPKKSFTHNIGIFGTNFSGEFVDQQSIGTSLPKYDLENCKRNKEIDEGIRSFFMSEDLAILSEKSWRDKNWRQVRVLNKWMKYRKQGFNLAGYFKENGWLSIAIYGAGLLAEHLVDELDNSEIVIEYLIDMNKKNVGWVDAEIKSPKDDLPTVDVVVVTPLVDMYKIKNQMSIKFKKTVPIITIEEIIML